MHFVTHSAPRLTKRHLDQYIQHTKDAIKALGVTTDPIDAVGSLTESDFPTEKVCKLKDDITKELQAAITFLQTEITFLKENVEDELMGMRSDLAQSRQERQEDSIELRKTIEEATANQAEMTNEKIAEMNQKFEDLIKTQRPGK